MAYGESYKEPKDRSKEGAPWNKRGYNEAPPAPVVPQKWNTRFDYQPKDKHSTYRATGGNNPFNPPLGMNVGKDFRSYTSNAPKGK